MKKLEFTQKTAEAGANGIGIKIVRQAWDSGDGEEQAYASAKCKQKSSKEWPLHGDGLKGWVRDWRIWRSSDPPGCGTVK